MGREAQQTDAGQLSRNLLLVPLATVNVKPNLQVGVLWHGAIGMYTRRMCLSANVSTTCAVPQIIADDVKCTHGCAVSDLQGEELFYFQ